ncbi:winged helix DNA-binding protein [Qipengyuania sp. DGS5-3]|uniref:winged helix DNA-binding protein n=1 Tax=Qipengyuania sp. DGS5-3 TaxID=3349632 RepID=UPI0036D3E677
MGQLAYCVDEITEAKPVLGEGARGSVSIFADGDGSLDILAQDAALVGFSISGRRALSDVMAQDAIVLGDAVLVECADADAGSLAALIRLDERAARSGASLIVSTHIDALEDVFGCVDRSEARILVGASRGERIVALGQALATLRSDRVREMEEGERNTLARLTDEVTRLARKLDGFSSDGASPTSPNSVGSNGGDGSMRLASPTQGYRYLSREDEMAHKPRTPLPDPRMIKSIIRERQRRCEFFDTELFADPAWDILLDLTAARAEHRRVSVTSLCIAANVPATTALRWISQMVDMQLLARVQDDTDRRRAFIVLTDNAADAMARYFDSLGTSQISPI